MCHSFKLRLTLIDCKPNVLHEKHILVLNHSKIVVKNNFRSVLMVSRSWGERYPMSWLIPRPSLRKELIWGSVKTVKNILYILFWIIISYNFSFGQRFHVYNRLKNSNVIKNMLGTVGSHGRQSWNNITKRFSTLFFAHP